MLSTQQVNDGEGFYLFTQFMNLWPWNSYAKKPLIPICKVHETSNTSGNIDKGQHKKN